MKSASWDDLRVLLEVHRQKSFLAAGTVLGLSTSTVARRVSMLEKSLGIPLVHRTSQGAGLEKDALELIALAERFEQSLSSRRRDTAADSPWAGTVRVSVPDGMGTYLVAPLARLRSLHPETHVEVSSEVRYVDLAAREADIGVRAGRRSSSRALIERPLGDVHSGLYASESYLARSLPKRVLGAKDYGAQDFIVEEDLPEGRGRVQLLEARGAKRFPFRSSAFEVRVRAAEEGMGLVILASATAAFYPRLHPVRTDTPFPVLPFYLAYHRDLRKLPRIRGVVHALTEAFQNLLR